MSGLRQKLPSRDSVLWTLVAVLALVLLPAAIFLYLKPAPGTTGEVVASSTSGVDAGLKGLGQTEPISRAPLAVRYLSHPLVIALIAAAFGALVIERLREMSSRVDAVRTDTMHFWQDVVKEVREVSLQEVQALIRQRVHDVTASVSDLRAEVKLLKEQNPWLEDIDPGKLALGVKHLEPIHEMAVAQIRAGRQDKARKLLLDVLEDPEMMGTPTDYHNLGVTAATQLDDDLLAAKFYEAYFERFGEENPILMSDALHVYTRSRQFAKAEPLAEKIEASLEGEDPMYVSIWRPWVFLADNYVAKRQFEKALELLERGQSSVKDPQERPHVLRNRGLILKQMGQTGNAEAAYRECLEQYPTHLPATRSLADVLWVKGDRAGAIEVLLEALQKGNLDPSLDFEVANVLKYLKRLGMSEEQLSEARGSRTGEQPENPCPPARDGSPSV